MLGGPTGDGRVYRKVIVLNRYDLVEANDISRHDGVVEKMKNRTTRIQYMTWFVSMLMLFAIEVAIIASSDENWNKNE